MFPPPASLTVRVWSPGEHPICLSAISSPVWRGSDALRFAHNASAPEFERLQHVSLLEPLPRVPFGWITVASGDQWMVPDEG
mmetsp:Transcript_9384/g.21169  ORF Transcript_9384/g.21169 Transcript_9384/m.21169 type:complete len:82 (+) Transcript_9384:98-343(+)